MDDRNTFVMQKRYGCCSPATFKIKDESGAEIFGAKVTETYCGCREDQISVTTLSGANMFEIHYHNSCCSTKTEVTVTNNSGSVIGLVKFDSIVCCTSTYWAQNASGDRLARIEEHSDCCTCAKREFEIFSSNDLKIGTINAYTVPGDLSIVLKVDDSVDSRLKTLLLASMFLIITLMENEDSS